MPKPLGMTKLLLMRLGFDERERSRLEMFGAARDVLNQVVLQTCLSRRGQILIDRADARVPVAIERLLIFRTLKETINYVDPPSCSEAVPFDTVDCHIHPRRGLGRSALVAQFYERSHAFAVVASCHLVRRDLPWPILATEAFRRTDSHTRRRSSWLQAYIAPYSMERFARFKNRFSRDSANDGPPSSKANRFRVSKLSRQTRRSGQPAP